MLTMIEEIKEQIPHDKRTILTSKLSKLQKRYSFTVQINRYLRIFASLCLVPFALLSLFFESYVVFHYCLYFGLGFLIISYIFPSSETAIKIQDIENELDLLSISEASIEQRAEKLFKLHQFELKKYYDQTLRQSSWIFVGGFACIVIGFTIIGITFYLVFSNSSSKELSEKIILASLGAIGAILSNFIAIIYIKMYSNTVNSLTEFHNRLVMTHHLHFVNFVISKIKDQTLREKTIAEIATNIAKKREV